MVSVLVVVVCFFGFGTTPGDVWGILLTQLRNHSCRCSEIHRKYWGSNLGQLQERQAPKSLPPFQSLEIPVSKSTGSQRPVAVVWAYVYCTVKSNSGKSNVCISWHRSRFHTTHNQVICQHHKMRCKPQ